MWNIKRIIENLFVIVYYRTNWAFTLLNIGYIIKKILNSPLFWN